MSPSLWVALLPRLTDSLGDLNRTTAIVIDTLRFTTTACQALQAGAASVRVAATIDQARRLAPTLTPQPLLCGERHCHPIDGFDLGNSPLEYTADRVAGQSLIFTTTNGTLAVEAVQAAAEIRLAGLVNRSAVCQQLQNTASPSIAIVCAGTDGQVAWEDVLTAGALLRGLLDTTPADTTDAADTSRLGNDAARLALANWDALTAGCTSQAALHQAIQATFAQAQGGQNLVQAGYDRDVEFAAQLDVSSAVPQASSQDRRLFSLDN